MQLKVFIGSSEKDKHYAKAVEKILQAEGVLVLGWWEVFPFGETLIESLEVAVRLANAAIFIAGPGDEVRTADGKTIWQPRPNVIFEYGMFVATRGRNRVGLAAFKEVALPSDLGGVRNIQLRQRDPFVEEEFIADNAAEIRKWLGPIRNTGASPTERVWTVAGEFAALVLQHLAPEIAKAKEIDMISIYRPIADVPQRLDHFRSDPNNRLRVCFADLWDSDLKKCYARKIAEKERGYFTNGVIDSIRRYLGDGAKFDPKKMKVTDAARYAADYRIYLTPQRITYNYCRVDGVMMISPLDMKTDKRPSPIGWVLRADDAPDAFSYYAAEFERVVKQSKQIHGRKKAGPPVV